MCIHRSRFLFVACVDLLSDRYGLAENGDDLAENDGGRQPATRCETKIMQHMNILRGLE